MRPLVGAIRWDAWHGAHGMPGRAVEAALGPVRWHHRLPFFAEARGEDDVRVDGTAPDVMDREIEYASRGGLDYWAFVAYPPRRPHEHRAAELPVASHLRPHAITSCAVAHPGDGCQPYARLAEHVEAFWAQCRDTGAQVAPIVMSGWDRRPRIARPMPWETWQKPGVGMDRYCSAPTPAELAGHMGRALDWIRTNEASARAGLVITYAWNENDEGGWLVPTLSEGTARLDALRSVLRPAADGTAGHGSAGA